MTKDNKNDKTRKGNRGEWSEPYVALKILGEGKLNLSDDDGNTMSDQWLNILEVIRHETFFSEEEQKNKDKVIKYKRSSDNVVDIYIDNKLDISITSKEFLAYATKLKENILKSRGIFSTNDDIESFLDKISLNHIKAKSIKKSDIFISTIDPRTSISRENIGFSIKSKFGNNPTLFNTGSNSAAVYKLTNMNDKLMEEINNLNDDKGHTLVSKRCETLVNNGCQLEFIGFPISTKHGYSIFEENLDIINPILKDVIDFILRTHFFTSTSSSNVKDMVDILIQQNPCNVTRPKEKYTYMIKSFLYAAYCGLTAGTLWDGKSQVNGGFIEVQKDGNVTASVALESDMFKSYLFKHCYFEWPSTGKKHGNYAYVYKENGEYYFRLNFQIRYK